LTVPENLPVGSIIYVIKPPDVSTQFRYTLSNDEGVVSVDDRGVVKTITVLDAEVRVNYEFTITSSNGQSWSLLVNVTDWNDNKPLFNVSSYTFTVADGFGGVIGKVSASDRDHTSPNNQLEFTVVGNENFFRFGDPASSTFNELTTKSFLDYQTRLRYDFHVQVTDKGFPPLQSIVPVTVQVQGDGEIAFQNISYFAEVSECTEIGALVVVVSAIGAKNIMYNIAKNNSNEIFEKFKLNEEGVLTLAGKLDAELRQAYSLTIQAQSGDSFTLANVLIEVVDANDNRPVFDYPFYTAELPQKKLIDTNTVVLKVRATDRDVSAQHGIIRYSIQAVSSSAIFSISSDGVIENTKPIPYKSQQEFIIIAVATDAKSPQLSGTAVVHIRFADSCQRSSLQEQIEIAVITSKALVGSLVTALKPTDVSDLKVSEYFNESYGEIRLSKALPPVSKVYHLNVLTNATNFTTQMTSVFIKVVHDDVSAPIENLLQYNLEESSSVGHVIHRFPPAITESIVTNSSIYTISPTYATQYFAVSKGKVESLSNMFF